MNISFVQVEPDEQAFFQAHLLDHNLEFVRELREVDPEADAVSVFIDSKIDRSFLETHPRVRLILSRSTTLDHIDQLACEACSVRVLNVPNYGDYTVAEHTLMLMLAVARRFGGARPRQFRSYAELRGRELRGRTLGVVGAGRIGMHVIELCRALGMRVLALDPQPQADAARELGFRYVSREELLAEAEVISLHAPLNRETCHFLGPQSFGQCRPGVMVINTARGALIDTEALLEALEAGIVSGVGLDVLEEERVMRGSLEQVVTDGILQRLQASGPGELRASDATRIEEVSRLLLNARLLARPEVVFTPHTAFNSVEAIARINQATLDNVRSYVASVNLKSEI